MKKIAIHGYINKGNLQFTVSLLSCLGTTVKNSI